MGETKLSSGNNAYENPSFISACKQGFSCHKKKILVNLSNIIAN